LAAAPDLLAAQSDVISGRVTNTEGLPLPGVRVSATSIPGSVTREARTNNQGSYQIVFPGGPGDYMMSFALSGYDFRQFQIKRLADEAVLVADARLSVMMLDTLVVAAPVQQRVGRGERTPDVSGTERAIEAGSVPTEQQGNIAAMAASLPGVVLVPGLEGEPDGFSVLGLGGEQNNVTLNGTQVGAGNLPRDAVVNTSLTTSPADPSRGGFSGASFNIGSRSGSNFRTLGMSLQLTSPQVQWTDPAARALGNEYANLSLGGTASGPIRRNKSFYNVSYELGRQSRDNQTLLGTSTLGLRTAGIAADSVARFVDILRGQRVPTGGAARESRLSDNGSVFGSLDFSPPGSTSGQSFGVTFNGSWRRQSPVGGGVTQLASAGGERTGWGGGIQGRHSGYFGLVLTETSAGVNLSGDSGEPFLSLPAGRVRVSSAFADGGSGVQSLVFGGNPGLSSASRSVSGSFQNSLSWFDDANKHRIKLSTELQYSGGTQDPSSNLLGSFTFNSLADLEAGRPASFSRTLAARERTTGTLTGALSIGDSYRRTPDLQFQYGLRVDAGRVTTRPAFNPLVEEVFGRRNDRVPSPVSVSPRFGFSWTVGRAPEVSGFAGAARAPRAVIRGGVGVFTNGGGVGQLGSVLDNTGLPLGAQQVVCVGPAAPAPEWWAYADDPAAVPDRCADGSIGTPFSNPAPNVTLFSPDFRPQQSVRSNLSWNGGVLGGRFTLGVEGTYSVNRHQQRTLDLNFDPTTRFTLAGEGRPVFVRPASIVPATGSVASRDARVSQAFASVSEVRSDLESRTAQLSVRLSPVQRGPGRFGWNASYTYSRVREQVSGFGSTAGNPLEVEWARSGQGPHQLNYGLRYNFFDAVQVNWSGWFRSGSAFTPTVAGDVNGDGSSFNDRAFVYSPAGGADPELAEGMRRLLAAAPSGTRACLEAQLGSIAARNSCRGPWSSGASLNATLDRAKFRLPQRGSVSFSLSNPLGAADLLVNGSGDLKGWGQSASADPSLLYVRGFDPVTRSYRYEVNRRFGATRPQFLTLRAPVMLTVSMRVDLGPTRERQNLAQQLGMGRSEPGLRMPEGLLRSVGSNSVQNPMSAILRQQDSLRLTAVQADSIASMNRHYTYRADSLWRPIARHFASLPAEFDERDAYLRYREARRKQIDMLMAMGPTVRGLLTPAQRRKLPAQILNLLDRRYLVSIRNGTGTYIGGGPTGLFGGPVEFFGGGGGGGETVIITRTFSP
ncbi:MAG TPA: carboxypeptidase-like regulatory domain-containing protein, partial [Longimicrobiaceae bacterium]|nr:carboxypeptidase-like regulatory domain-containing protein [Longimicrobiaceae bacterium]